MIPKVSRGGSMGGLLAYLAGPGHGNEHALPHVIAGDAESDFSAGVLRREQALAIARELDAPRQTHGTAVLVKGQAKHVWHCSLSLSPDEPALTDEKWREVAEGFVRRMGFRDDCRWAAVRHGLSKNGGDHVHVVVNLCQHDGRAADTWNDRPRAQAACAELEREHGLRVIETRELGVGARGATRPALERAATLEREPEAEFLERVVRAAAIEARDEGEFVRLVREQGVRVRPRYAMGSRETVGLSYSVSGSASYGGARLARDLSLPRLRERWAGPAAETADQAAHDAAGKLAAWSIRSERTPGPIAHESRQLGRYAQTRTSGGLTLTGAMAAVLRERIRAANREAELQRELDEREQQQRRSPTADRDRGIDL